MFDADRQARLIYPPVFLIASLVLGIYLDRNTSPSDVLNSLTGQTTFADWSKRLLALAAAGGLIIMIASGFLISSITVFMLRADTDWRKANPYEADLPDATYDRIRELLGLPPRTTKDKREAQENGDKREPDALYLSATLDHEQIQERVHKWIFRRWSNFYVAANSGLAIVLAQPVGWFVGVFDWWWILASVLSTALLFRVAWWARRDTMGMLEFQARLLNERRKKEGERKEKERGK